MIGPSSRILASTADAARGSAPPGEPRLVGLAYAAPSLLFFTVFGLYPFVNTVWLSFTRWNGVGAAVFIGPRNYADIVSDPGLYLAFVRSLILVGFYSLIPVGIGLLLAALLSRIPIRGIRAFRVLLFLPQTVAMVVVAIAWSWIYSRNGALNELLRLVGLDGLTRAWLGDFTWALPAVGLVGTWVNFGLCMVLFVAGVQKIPLDLYDAARVDGAGPVSEFFAVTLPGLRNEILVALTITVIFALRNFDLVWVATRGGPGDATAVPAVLLYQLGFEARRIGAGAAIAVILTAVILVVTIVITRLGERGQESEAAG
ncbi:MAG TPA: sugar ABC transporter permease [Candidatus Limnocylindrales bacterium]|jgi:raffinose/stachyose/melibiose transport system permease protein|nr:sugar ABC transporter permease [Candidatus Limnocylindrales bacterium]